MPCIQISGSQSQCSQSLGSSLAYIVFSSVFPGREKAQEMQTNWEEQDGAENWGSVPYPSTIMTWDLWKTLYQGHFMWPRHWNWAQHSKSPLFGLMLCSHQLENLNFWTRAPHVHFCTRHHKSRGQSCSLPSYKTQDKDHLFKEDTISCPLMGSHNLPEPLARTSIHSSTNT